MSKRANPTLIGAFVVGAIALAVAAVLVLAGDQLFRTDRSTFVMYFNGSVKGLNVGSPVMFRGVNIGTVTNIQLVVGEDDVGIAIPVIVEVDNTRFIHASPESLEADTDDDMDTLIEAGLRAQLQLQSLLTGQLFVQIDFHPDTRVKLVNDEMYKGKYEEIPTIPTPIEKLGKSLQDFPVDEVLENIASTAEGLDKLVNSPHLNQSITALHEALDGLKSLVVKINAEVEPLVADADGVMNDARAVLKNIDGAVDDAGKALRQADETLQSVETLAENEILLTQLERALTAISNAARSVQLLAESIERQPNSLIRGRQ